MELEALVGHMLAVRGGAVAVPGMYSTFFGVLEEVEDGAIYLRDKNGESLFIPLDGIREWTDLGVAHSERADTFLRPSEDPDRAPLLRPAQQTAPDPAELPRVPRLAVDPRD